MGLEFTKAGELHRIMFEDGSGDWVDIKDRQSYGDRLKVAGAATGKMHSERDAAGKPTPTFDTDFGELRLRLLETSIVAWSSDQPVRRSSFVQLDSKTGDYLAEKISEHYEAQAPDEEELGNSAGLLTEPSTPNSPSRLSSVS